MLIGELAKVAGMSKDGIRLYEAVGLIASTPRAAGSRTYRDYGPDAAETISKVRQAQRLGFSLKEIGPILRAYAEHPPNREQDVAFLEQRLAVIQGKRTELGEIEDFIRAKLARYRAETADARTSRRRTAEASPPLQP